MVFKNKLYGDFINEQFVSVRINGNKEEGKKLREKFNVRGYPTVLFLNAEGEEIDRNCGFDGNKEVYFQKIKDYAVGKNTLSAVLADVEKNPDNVESNYKMAMKLNSRWESEKAHPYFKKILELDPKNEKGFNTESNLNLAIYEARMNKNIVPLEKFMAKNTDSKFFELGYGNLLRFYRNEKKTDKAIKIYELMVNKQPENASQLNRYAWYIYENKISKKYERGIELAAKAVALEPHAHGIWDTLAWLYFENGDTDKAVESMKKAIELKPDEKNYRESLEKIKQGKS